MRFIESRRKQLRRRPFWESRWWSSVVMAQGSLCKSHGTLPTKGLSCLSVSETLCLSRWTLFCLEKLATIPGKGKTDVQKVHGKWNYEMLIILLTWRNKGRRRISNLKCQRLDLIKLAHIRSTTDIILWRRKNGRRLNLFISVFNRSCAPER